MKFIKNLSLLTYCIFYSPALTAFGDYIPRWEAYNISSEVVEDFFNRSNYPERLKNICKDSIDPEKHRNPDGRYNAVYIRREVLNRIIISVKNNALDIARKIVDRRLTLSKDQKTHIVFKVGDTIASDISETTLHATITGGFKKFLNTFRSLDDLVANLVEHEIHALANAPAIAPQYTMCALESDHRTNVMTLPCGDTLCKSCIQQWYANRKPFTCPICLTPMTDEEISPYVSQNLFDWLLGR